MKKNLNTVAATVNTATTDAIAEAIANGIINTDTLANLDHDGDHQFSADGYKMLVELLKLAKEYKNVGEFTFAELAGECSDEAHRLFNNEPQYVADEWLKHIYGANVWETATQMVETMIAGASRPTEMMWMYSHLLPVFHEGGIDYNIDEGHAASAETYFREGMRIHLCNIMTAAEFCEFYGFDPENQYVGKFLHKNGEYYMDCGKAGNFDWKRVPKTLFDKMKDGFKTIEHTLRSEYATPDDRKECIKNRDKLAEVVDKMISFLP